jgi:two-component system, NtrC family, response regulator AtoC
MAGGHGAPADECVLPHSDLPDNVATRAVGPAVLLQGPRGEEAGDGFLEIPLGTPLAEIERRLIEETLRVTHGHKTLTARLLGVDQKTIFRRLKQRQIGPALEPPS